MTRTKFVRVAIVDEIARKQRMRKRTQSLFKKVTELTILCDVEAVVIVQDPRDNEEALWPSRAEVEDKVRRYMNTPDIERFKKMTTYENFLLKNLKTKEEKLKKLVKMNEEREMAHLLNGFMEGRNRIQDLDLRQTDRLIVYVKNVMKALDKKNDGLMVTQKVKKQQADHNQPLPPQIESETLPNHACNNIASFPLQNQENPPVFDVGNCSNDSDNLLFFLQQQDQFLGGGGSSQCNHPLQEQVEEFFDPGFGLDSYHGALDSGPSASLLEDGSFFEALFENDDSGLFGQAAAAPQEEGDSSPDAAKT